MPNDTDGEGQNGDKPLTLADLKALLAEERKASTEALSAAISGTTKRLNKQWEEKLAKLKPAAEADGEGDEEPTETAGTKAGKVADATGTQQAKPDPLAERLAKLEAEYGTKLKRLEAESKQAKDEVAKERRSNVEAKAYSVVRSALTGKVVSGAEDSVLDLLRARGRIHIDESGVARLRGIVKDEPEDGFDIEAGIPAYLKSDEAKFFLPPPNAGPANGKRSQSFGNAPNGANGSGPRDAVDAFEAKHGSIAKSLI